MCPVGVATSRSSQIPQTATANLWLILVGVNQYQDEQLPNLNYSAVDCQGLAEALMDATALRQKEAKVYHDFAIPPLLESVRTTLQKITAIAKPTDTILFYFSGHGIVEPNTQQAFLCLADTQKSNLFDTGLAIDELLQLLKNCAAQTQLLWLDACHSGVMTLQGATAELLVNPTQQFVEVLQQAAKSRRFYALLSCDLNQRSWEFPELQHGVFTYYLMQGLRGNAADPQGLISADSLYRYVYHQTLQYIDKTNQQLRLINQQKRSKGNTQLFSEYPLQTPKRIVEGVGELIVGIKSSKVVGVNRRRLGLVVEGTSGSQVTLEISKVLGSARGFELEYLSATKATAHDVREAISSHLQSPSTDTVLLYLRGRIEETEAWEGLVLGEDIRIKRSWLKQQLRSCRAKQIIILDCPIPLTHFSAHPSLKRRESDRVVLQDWVEDLLYDSQQGQCLIACASHQEEPERFAQTLLHTLEATAATSGLSAAGAIAQLQLSLAGSNIPFHVWLSGVQGIIEILEAKTDGHREEQTGLDLGVCPYMGLSSFCEDDSRYFYGREILTQQLINQLTHNSFLAVVGASASGKSSVVQAGLIPALRLGKQIPHSEQWWIKSIRPGALPLLALAQRLRGFKRIQSNPSPPLPLSPSAAPFTEVEEFVYWIRSLPHEVVVLVIDQFEELFTLASKTDREHFLELVLGAVKYASDRFKLVITLRADFIASCLTIPELALALQESSVLVSGKLNLSDYRRVILNPAQKVGLKVEPELVEVLLRELNHSVGDLPLLEFVLEQLWQHRVAGELTLQAYQEQLGGIKGALERSCQAVYNSLDPAAKECAKWIFLSLTQLGEGTEDTRRRVLKSELIVKKYPEVLVERTLNALIAAKLVVVNVEEEERGGEGEGGRGRGGELSERTFFKAQIGDTIERNLTLLSEGESLDNGAGSTTHNLGKPSNVEGVQTSVLQLPAVTVEVAHEILIQHWSTLRWWLEENRDRLRKQRQIEQASRLWLQSDRQSDFLLQGVRLAEAEDIYTKWTDELSAEVQCFIEACLAERKRQELKEKRIKKQTHWFIVTLGSLAIATSGFALLAFLQGREAQMREIEALNSSSKANLASNQQLEALIASVKAGKQIQKTLRVPANIKSVTESALLQITNEIQERNRLEKHNAGVVSVSFSPNGKLLASASLDKTIKIWSRDGRLLKTFTGHSNAISSISFAPDSQTIASTSVDKTIKIWRVSDGSVLRTIAVNSQTAATFSPDGKTIASANADETVKIWNASDGRLLRTLKGHNDGVICVSYSPDGKIIASGSEDKTIKLWSISDGHLLKTLTGHTDWINSIAFSPDGKTIVSGSRDNTVKLWSIGDGHLITSLSGHSDSVLAVAFSPDGKTIASASADNTVKLWSYNGVELETFRGDNGGVSGVSFSRDSRTIASASLDGTIRLWQQPNRYLLDILAGYGAGVNSATFSPDGRAIASASFDGTIRLWRRDGTPLHNWLGHTSAVYNVAFSPDGQTIASASADQTVKLWRTSDGALLRTLVGHTDEVDKVSFSPDGKMIATAGKDNIVKLWQTSSGTWIRDLKGHEAEVYAVSFSPDGQTIASASVDNTIKLWESSTGRLLRTIPAHNQWILSVSFSPDGKMIASSSADRTIKLWRSSDGHLLHTFTGHTDTVYSTSFSPDGKVLASASGDKTIKVWSLDGKLLKTYLGHRNAVLSVGFSPDGKTVISASWDGTVRLWRFDPQELKTPKLSSLIHNACDLLHDYLHNDDKVTSEDKKLCQ